MKKLFAIAILVTLLLCVSCSAKSTNLIEATTVAGEKPEIVLDGKAKFKTANEPFEAEEIKAAISPCEHSFASDYGDGYLYDISKGYYGVFPAREPALDFGFFYIPVVNNKKIVGTLTIHRDESGNVQCGASSMDGDEGSPIDKVLTDYPNEEVVVIFPEYSFYAITSDNKIHIIYGFDPTEIKNSGSLYEAYKTEYNTISSADF